MIYLVNWTHEHNRSGGTESRYSILKDIFPDAKMISANEVSNEKLLVNKARSVDKVLNKIVKKDDLVIKDAGVGISELKCKKILFFGNPYKSLLDSGKFEGPIKKHWQSLLNLQEQDRETADFCIANSTFSARDAKSTGSTKGIDCILPNSVDTAFFQPPVNKKGKYIISVGSRFKFSNSNLNFVELSDQLGVQIKCVSKKDRYTKDQMLYLYQSAICYLHPFWIEGNSNSVLEALACNLPVVTPRCGFFYDDTIDGAGEFYSDQDSAYFALRKVLDNMDYYTPRGFVFKNNLTKEKYSEKIKELLL